MNTSTDTLHYIGDRYYMGSTLMSDIVAKALTKPQRYGTGWARLSTEPKFSPEYHKQLARERK